MTWQIVLLFNILIYSLAVVLIKILADKLKKSQSLFFYSLFAFLFSLAYLLASGTFLFTPFLLLAGTMGFFGCMGAYFQWKAVETNLSRTSLYTPLIGVFAIILSFIFLKEFRSLNPLLLIGIILSFASIYLFVIRKSKRPSGSKKWFFYIFAMILIMGLTTFAIKVFSFNIDTAHFLTFWYLGSFLGAIPLLFAEKQNPFKWPGKTALLLPLASLAILGNLATEYWSFQLADLHRIVPIKSAAGLFIPVIAGLFLFKEHSRISKKQALAFAIGLLGALLIILS